MKRKSYEIGPQILKFLFNLYICEGFEWKAKYLIGRRIYSERCGDLSWEREQMILTYLVPTILLVGKYGNLILMQAPPKSELKWKQHVKIIIKITLTSNVVVTCFGDFRFSLLNLSFSVCHDNSC